MGFWDRRGTFLTCSNIFKAYVLEYNYPKKEEEFCDIIKMAITKEQAKIDLEKVMAQFGTFGAGTELDRAAQLVMQPIGVLERRLGKIEMIKMLYFDMQDSSKMLPLSVYDVAQRYVAGSIDENTARAELQDIEGQYGQVFQEMGLSPQVSKVLFGKFQR